MIKPLHTLWRLLPPQYRRYGLAKIGAFLAPSIATNPIISHEIIIGGEISRASGLGEGARLMYQSLKKHNIPTYLLDISPYSPSIKQYNQACRLLAEKPHATLILHINAPQIPFALLNLPKKLLKNRKIIGYWAWELLSLPKDWEVGFQFVHEIWVPSDFTKHSLEFLADKYHKIIKVIPHPVADQNLIDFSHITREYLNLPVDKTVILTSFSLASSFVRKNPLASIRAFQQACGNMADVCLVLKITHTDHYPEDLNIIINAIKNYKNIIILTQELSSIENQALISRSDILLSLHRSEGFGLVLAEAMLFGVPVIFTNWSAPTEFLDSNSGIPIDYDLIPVTDNRKVYQVKNAYWAEANVENAVNSLKKILQDKNYYFTIRKNAYKKAQQQFNSKQLMKGLSAIGVIQL